MKVTVFDGSVSARHCPDRSGTGPDEPNGVDSLSRVPEVRRAKP